MKLHKLGALIVAGSLAIAIMAVLPSPPAIAAGTSPVSAQEARDIAVDTYIYAYPLVLVEITRRVSTANGSDPQGRTAPMNQFAHSRVLPDAGFTAFVGPNPNMLTLGLWYDVSKEPLVIGLPDSGGRYYLVQFMDMWTDTFASPGKRTTGTQAQTIALVGPRWHGILPADMQEIRSPTDIGLLGGRIQTNGPGDFAAVHEFQRGFSATPLSRFGKAYTPPKVPRNPNIDMSPPVDQVTKMDAATFFAMFTELMKGSPPHANDYPILAQMARIGIVPGKRFDLAQASPDVKAALEAAPSAGMRRIQQMSARESLVVNRWSLAKDPIGTYGAAYGPRAVIAYIGLAANVPEDAYYPTMSYGPDGKPLDSGQRYVMHFAKDQMPPVRAFWSVTVLNDRRFLAANPINRFTLSDYNKLKYNQDGSLDLYVQRQSPGADKESNWLPTPASGRFYLTMRLYWPKPEAVDGTWAPPSVVVVQ